MKAKTFVILFASVTLSSSAYAKMEISNNATQNVSCTARVCTATSAKAVLNVNDLTGMLATGDVKVQSGSIAKDIDIYAPLSWPSASRLTLDSYRSIGFNKPLIVAGNGALTIATNDGGTGGDFRFFGTGHVRFENTNDSLIVNGRAFILTKSLKSLRLLVRKNENGAYALANHIASRKLYDASPIVRFGGILEGLGNAISGLAIDSTVDRDNVAFIGQFVSGAIVRDIGVKDVQITGTGAEQCVAALLGVNAGGTVANSYATGSATAANSTSIGGGLVCDNQFGSVRQSSSDVHMVGADNTPVGGLVGVNEGACHGSCDGSIYQSFSTGSVSGGTVGGLVGRNLGGSVTNSYATGPVTGGSGAFVGGLVGSNENDDEQLAEPVIAKAYSVGFVSGGTGAVVGGFIGRDIAAPGISNAYWDLDTSGISDPHRGAGNVDDDPGITGLTDAQLKSGLPGGLTKPIWQQKMGINNGYPYLPANPPRHYGLGLN